MKRETKEIKCLLRRLFFLEGKMLRDFSVTLEYSFIWEDFITSSGLAYSTYILKNNVSIFFLMEYFSINSKIFTGLP